MNYLKIFCDSFLDNWDNPAVTSYSTGLTLTYGGLAARIERVRHLFEMLKIPAGTHVAIIGNNSIDWVTNYIAALVSKTVAVSLQVTYDHEDILSLLAAADAEIIFIDPEIMPAHIDTSDMPSLKLVISQDTQTVLLNRGDTYANPQQTLDNVDFNFMNLFPNGFMPIDFNVPETQPDAIAAIFFTAGTTGQPKPVSLTCDNIEGNLIYGIKATLFPHGSHTLTSSSVGNVWGTIYNVIVPLASGAHIDIFNNFYNSEALVQAYRKVKPRRVIMSPMQLRDTFYYIKDKFEARPIYRTLKYIPFGQSLIHVGMRRAFNKAMGGNCTEVVIGSTNVDRHLKRQLERVGINFTVAYGQVECGGLVCYSPAASYDPETVGKPISGIIKCRIRPMEIKGLPDDTGILEIRGMTIMKGYYNDPESTQEAFTQDGWLSTRDLGYINEQGSIIIVGRIDTLIERPGGTIIPERLESKILNNPEIKQVIVTDRDGFTTAIVVPDNDRINDDTHTIVKQIIDKVNSIVPAFARIDNIEISETPLDLTLKGTVARYKYF